MRGLSLPYISPPPGIDIRKIWGYLEGSGDAWKDALYLLLQDSRKPNCKGLQMISEKCYKVGFYWR